MSSPKERKDPPKKCAHCGEKYHRRPTEAEKAWVARKFCGQPCSFKASHQRMDGWAKRKML